MDRDDRALLGTDAVRRDGAVRPREKHTAPDQKEGSDEHSQAELDDHVEPPLDRRRRGGFAGRCGWESLR
jgi:hypothetical protein